MTLEIAPAMAKEHLLAAESKGMFLPNILADYLIYFGINLSIPLSGLLCRDTSPDGFRFFVNLFPEINLDDMYL